MTNDGKKWNWIFDISRSGEDFANPPASKCDWEQGPDLDKNHWMPAITFGISLV